MKRVVVTGVGVVSCLGNNQDEVFKSLLNSNNIIDTLLRNMMFKENTTQDPNGYK